MIRTVTKYVLPDKGYRLEIANLYPAFREENAILPNGKLQIQRT
jgi:hypothetical protein